MIRAEILTPWVGTGLSDEDKYRAKLGVDFPGVLGDVTGQPAANLKPDPNLFIVEIVRDASTLDAIAAHPDYGPAAILWSEEIVEDVL